MNVFKAGIAVSSEVIQKIERETMQQRNSALWFEVRRYRLTASLFWEIAHRTPTTPPGSLVLRILQPNQFSSTAVAWGIAKESTAIEEYICHQKMNGHPDLTVSPCGFHISEFFCTLDGSVMSLRCNYRYFTQLQGQMAIGGREWCDFVV